MPRHANIHKATGHWKNLMGDVAANDFYVCDPWHSDAIERGLVQEMQAFFREELATRANRPVEDVMVTSFYAESYLGALYLQNNRQGQQQLKTRNPAIYSHGVVGQLQEVSVPNSDRTVLRLDVAWKAPYIHPQAAELHEARRRNFAA